MPQKNESKGQPGRKKPITAAEAREQRKEVHEELEKPLPEGTGGWASQPSNRDAR